ncbi:MAG: hypothetical protein RLZZ203_459 [Cyanobacteriota bacterium]|jgi:hypothetical protein
MEGDSGISLDRKDIGEIVLDTEKVSISQQYLD